MEAGARSRRRPARYSPELSAAAAAAAAVQSEMSIGALLTAAESEHSAALDEGPSQQLQEQADAAFDGEMVPGVMPAVAATRRPGRPRKRSSNHLNNNNNNNNNSSSTGSKRRSESVKRPRVANVLLENEMLIDEIRERKALWQRTHEQHHSSVLTAPLWDEIAKNLDTTQESIRRRWKSLKDHYRRELKKSMTDATAPPSQWPYYKKMRFMKSQMFVSLRRKNGEDHLEILSDDGEENSNGEWNGHLAEKQEGDSDTMDGYELTEYEQLIKYEQQMEQELLNGEMNGTQEGVGEEEEIEQQLQDGQEEQEQEQLSPIASLHEQEELSSLQQQQQDVSELSNMSTMQDQPDMSNSMADMVGIPTTVTTTASSLSNRMVGVQQRTNISGRMSAMQQRASDMAESLNMQRSLQQPRDINNIANMADMSVRHEVLQQQRAQVNDRISAIQRDAEMAAMQRRADINSLHERAEMTAMQQRAEMQRRNNSVENGVDTSSVSSLIGDERGGISDDYHFFMSLMPHVRHFTSLQKLKVRNRIQQIIIEEASNVQYDPLAN